MPITKIPIVHKFGIISHTQRLELQERLLKQSYIQTLKSQKVLVPTRNPLEVSEDFVQEYNNAKDFDEKEKLEQSAQKMLERSKRRAGLKDGGVGKHVNLPMAWTELAQLAQCRGKIQEECLDVLIISLDQSPLEKYHIPALFFLAETMLYWLRTDAVHQPYLRTGEIKLLKMGQLVFSRLFYHHMAGQLSGQKDFKNRLFTYLDGLQECQEAYSPYPNALLSLRFIITVGKIIMSDTQLEPGEIKEGDNVRKSALSRPSAKSTDTGKRTTAHSKDLTTHTAHSVAISSSVHDLSPTLWHALDVWRCTNHLSGGLTEALKALSHCGMGLVNESWVDSMIALQILAEASKSSLMALRALHNLARGYRPGDKVKSPPVSSRSESSEQKLKQSTSESYSYSSDETSPKDRESRASVASSKPTLSDIYERSEEGDSEKMKTSATGSAKTKSGNTSAKDTDLSEASPSYVESPSKKDEPNVKEMVSPTGPGTLKREVSFDTGVPVKDEDIKSPVRKMSPKSTPGTRAMTQGSRTTAGTGESMFPPGTGYQAEAGTTLPSGRASEASTVQTYTNAASTDLPGINGWHWEVAITYTDVLADICLHGGSAEIQKLALMGTNQDVADPFKRGYNNLPLHSAGLLDLAFFKAVSEARDGGPNDWSWRIRFGAVQSMVKICRCLANDKNKEGIRTAAWNVLLRAHSMEKDERVLEALKVGQVHTDIEGFLNKQLVCNPYTLGSKVAAGLSVIYLPPLPPPVDPYVSPKRRELTPSPNKATTTSQESMPQVKEKHKARTSLKEEIMLATALYEPSPSFNTRTSFDLRRIVEDQWRKDLQKQMEEEEAERQKALKERQKEEEEFQRQIEEKRQQKFSKS
ncbi:transmembrane protein 232-like isoform X2 [Ruditapes philippinarum]|uniref:transmembrane protein 232-like isoform X2 n=1 Tax=Ruditapes philippinarum TaxID=129788 RepID=UPI00295C01DE|nr:transmembrane protein 232-like isoform X2 [Ruditapes philippinarum]